jgi:hypothetical protein
MRDEDETPEYDEYEVGYAKPPARTRFRKGVSGNPGGRPRGITKGRANQLALKEAYRLVKVREGDKVLTLPAIQVTLRNLVASAAKGSGPAQRTLIGMTQTIEREASLMQAAKKQKAEAEKPVSDLDAARRVAFLLTKGARQNGHPQPKQSLSSLVAKIKRDQ